MHYIHNIYSKNGYTIESWTLASCCPTRVALQSGVVSSTASFPLRHKILFFLIWVLCYFVTFNVTILRNFPSMLKYSQDFFFKFASFIDFDKYCKDQDTEVCVLKLKSTFSNVCVMAVIGHPLKILICFLIGWMTYSKHFIQVTHSSLYVVI